MIKLNNLLKLALEIRVLGVPPQLVTQLSGVDGVATVMPGAVRDEVIFGFKVPHKLENQPDDLKVAALVIGTDHITLTRWRALQNGPDGAGVIFHMDPVANVFAIPVELGTVAA